MPTFQLIKNGIVDNTIIAQREVPQEIADQYDEIIDVTPEPGPEKETKILLPTLSVLDFRLRFTNTERVEMKSGRSSHPVIDEFLLILEEMEEVDLNTLPVQEFIDYLVDNDFINSERKNEILS